MCYIEVEVVFDWSTISVFPTKTVKFSECGTSSRTLKEMTYMYFIHLLNDCEGNTFRTGISEKGRKNSHYSAV